MLDNSILGSDGAEYPPAHAGDALPNGGIATETFAILVLLPTIEWRDSMSRGTPGQGHRRQSGEEGSSPFPPTETEHPGESGC
jgi:hypothetical protein